MLINEVAKQCGITKKAVQYYVEQHMVNPNVLENGYKDFAAQDVEIIKRIVLYRRLGLSIPEIKQVLEKKDNVKNILYQKTLDMEKEKIRHSILKKIAEGESVEELSDEINEINSKSVIIKRLLDLFPSYYGKFISLNFSRYLTRSIETEEQKNAFQEIIEFFDNVPDMTIPIHLQEYLDQYLELYSGEEGTEKINSILQEKQDAMQDINAFVDNNKEILDAYHNFKQTEEYKSSPAYQFMELMKEFCSSNGYYDVFIPAMRRLSPLYNEYYEQMLRANEEFIKKHPEYIDK
ncbi:MAG: MerR family transcriptional regulator [Tyzzerella sp.]|nr:MerR family transcriptional regulator [Tyzzerella sp.]